MKILVTGSQGFVGRNLVSQLRNIQEGKARCYGDLTVSAVYEYDIDSSPEELEAYCRDCNFVFKEALYNGLATKLSAPGIILAFCTNNPLSS